MAGATVPIGNGAGPANAPANLIGRIKTPSNNPAMVVPRLRTKAAGYAAYAAEAAWAQRHPYCPCLLFLTTRDTRAFRFLKAVQAALEKAARERVRHPRRPVVKRRRALVTVGPAAPEQTKLG